LTQIAQSNLVFNKIALFDAFADTLLLKDEHKKQFIIYDNTIDALYEACRPDILKRRKDFPMAAIVHYLREVIDGKADRSDLDSAKRRISQLLNDSIVAEETQASNGQIAAEPLSKYGIKEWKQIDLGKLNIEKLKAEYKQAVYKNIEIADLRAFIDHKLQMMLTQNVSRQPFGEKLQEIIDKYNAGITTQKDYFDELVDFFEQMKDEDKRAYREGLTEAELEIFDLLKKENLTKDEEQKVKIAAKSLLIRLKEERPTVLINDWHKDTQTKLQVELAIQTVLDNYLPASYNRAIYKNKCTDVYNHFLTMAQNGQYRAYV
jgi:type I restriction enzyme, R subunit